jgi:polyhydroxybutyrate depolymerase
MAWRYASESGDGIKAVMSISATLATSGECAQEPTEFREVYGLRDTVLDFPFGPNGETTFPVIFWRNQYGCPETATQTTYSITGNREFTQSVWACGDNKV